METLFWSCIGLVTFSYFGYPLLLAAWDGAREALAGARWVAGGPERRVRGRDDQRWPSVTILVSAFNEETCIGQKIENCLAVDYPADRLEVLVGCDGCDDRTAELARNVSDPRVRVVELRPRAGKASVVTQLLPTARGEVVVLTDANTLFDRGAVKALARRFQDPSVGAVVGRLRLYNRVRRDYEESIYWKYETILKYYEGKHGCVLGANGGLYAIRRLLFSALRPSTIIDDFIIPVRIAARGWKVPFEPEAVAYEETTEDYGREFGRRARIGAGNWQALMLVPEVLDPRTGFLFFAFVAHKLLRWMAPLLLSVGFLANLALAGRGGAWGYRFLFLGQLAFVGLALGGRLGLRGPWRRLTSIAHYFVSMNAALAVGFWRFLRGTQRAAWQRTERTAGHSGPGGARAA